MVYRNPPPTTETFVQEGHSSLLNHVKKENNYAKPQYFLPDRNLCARIRRRPFPRRTHKSEKLMAVTYSWANPGLRKQGANVRWTRSFGQAKKEQDDRKSQAQTPKSDQRRGRDQEEKTSAEDSATNRRRRRRSRAGKKISTDSEGWLEENWRGEEKVRRDRNYTSCSASLYIADSKLVGSATDL